MVSPGSGEVLVEVRAVSLNYRDVEGLFEIVELFPGNFGEMES
jgi:hypothetical protein